MTALFSIASLFIFLGAGLGAAQFRLVRENPLTEKLSVWALYGLLFFMGFRIAVKTGADRLFEIGILSVVFTLSTVAGTVIVLLILYSVIHIFNIKKYRSNAANDKMFFSAELEDFSNTSAMFQSVKLILIVAAGFTAGWFVKIPGFTGEGISGWMLRFLLFSIGIDMVKGGVSLKETLAKPETIYLPAGVVAGSLLGALIPAAAFGIDVGKSLAVASGFGWYSLSGVLITDMGDAVLGSASFMSNILRETAALLTIPFISRSRFPHIGIGIAGATSMDVTLPLIEKSCGPDSVPVSIASGAALSLLVPVLVPLFFQL